MAGVVLASCTVTEYNDNTTLEGADTVVASIGEDTRTTYGTEEDGAHKVLWSAGDRILVATGSGNANQATYTTKDGGSTSAVFVSDDPSKKLDFSSGAIAGYPSENMYITSPDPDKEIFFTIPEVQEYCENSFADNAMPMISDVTYDNVFHFKNAAGVMRLILSSDRSVSVSSITVTSSQYICGESGYIPKHSRYFFDSSMMCSNTVTVDCGSGVKVGSDGTAFNIVVPHQTYEDLTIIVKTSDKKEQMFQMKEGKSITIQRSVISTIPLKLDNLAANNGPYASIEVSDITFNNFNIDVSIKNTSSYYCGLVRKKDYDPQTILRSIEYVTKYTSPLSYSGSVMKFQEEMADVLLEPGETYILWIVPSKSGDYTISDIYTATATLKSFTSGGNISITTSGLTIDRTSISIKVSAKGAMCIYSTLIPEDKMSSFNTEQKKIDHLLAPGGTSTVFNSSDDNFVRKSLKPGVNYTFLSIAVDRNGKYGPLFEEVYTTESIPYNSMTVTIDKDIDELRSTSTVKWSVSGGEASEYRYIFRGTDGNLWKNTLEGSVQTAQEIMFMSPDIYYISKTKESQAVLSGLTSGKEYVIVVTAADENGNGSIADSWIFTY